MDVPSQSQLCSMFSASYAKQRLVILVLAILPGWVGLSVAFAETPTNYTVPPKVEAANAVTSGPQPPPTPPPQAPEDTAGRQFYIREYRVSGSKILTPLEIGDTVYPFLGPGRTAKDVEAAAAALEQKYHDRGYQTVSVQIPAQTGRGGVVFLQVTEATVGRLRVKGSHYYSLDAIKKGVPSIAEGKVPNFNDLTREIIALNQWPDRRVEPNMHPGVEPGTYDIDLNVKDSSPLHGSVEFNNRYSPDTTQLRINGGVSYGNLWQLGHAAGVSFQISPENTEDVKVISAYYLARIPGVEWLTLTLQGTKQDSNVSTLSGAAVAGKGETIGLRAGITLPPLKDYVHSVSLGIDYKHYEQNVLLGLDNTSSPTSYYPLSIAYSGSWFGHADKEKKTLGYSTDLNAGIYFHFRGLGSSETSFDNSRFGASGNFIYFRGDLSHEHDLPGGFQVMGKIQGQVADQPLLSAEQFSAGGLSSVRGYLEGEVPGDNAFIGSIELRSPNFINWIGQSAGEWRLYTFFDYGYVSINDPLPEQESHWTLASIGAGSRIRLFDHLNGSIDAGLPLTTQSHTVAHDWLFTFRVWADF